MKLIIRNESHPFKREIEVLYKLFEEDEDELIYSDSLEDGIVVSLESYSSQSKIKAIGKVLYQNNEKVFIKEKDIEQEDNGLRKASKQALSYVWIKILTLIYNKTHPWGILTGIRPTKLYHKLLQTRNHQEVREALKEDYLVESEKINILKEIVERQLKVIPDLYEIDEEVSLYIGIPFCPTKCAYCTFPAYAIKGKNANVEEFLIALDKEIDMVGQWLKETNRKVTTIYFGGGTPTSIEADQIDAIFKRLTKWLNLEEIREITVEAGRPDTITIEKLEVLLKWKVDRISINPQSFTQETLDVIGRDHTVKETVEKYQMARSKGINNINMDLIIGLPGEELEHLMDSLEHIDSLQPESLTIHTMAFKRASYLTKNKEKFSITDPAEVWRMMKYASEWTKENEYHPYYLYRQKNMLGNLENIGYSKNGKESLYNILIMEERQTIIGLGSGAASKLIPPKSNEVYRVPNPKDPKPYVETIEEATVKKIKKLKEIFKT